MVAFVSGGSNLLMGTLSTGGDGEGNLQTTLGSGSYAGHFELTRGDTLQFISANVSFTIGLTASITTTSSSETSSSETATSQTTSTETSTRTTQGPTTITQIDFRVEPPLKSVDAGQFAKFEIKIATDTEASILLVARGVPNHAMAIFTPETGATEHEFHSTLTIVTDISTPAGLYGITVLAMVNGQEFDAQVALQVNGGSTTQTSTTSATSSTTTTTTVSGGTSLSLTLKTDQEHYEPNSTVALQGHVTDDTGSAVPDARVSVQVDGPAGAEIKFVTDLKTDAAGFFQVSLPLSTNVTLGTYTAFASASKTGFRNTTTHTTFVIGTSSTPSVVIKDLYVTDTNGNRSAVFSTGQTVLVWVLVENSGAPFEGVIWVQIRDPNGVPTSIQLQITTLNTGATIKVAFGFTYLANPTAGLYTANALVSDKLISQGGVFFASADTQFALAA
jgi:hypothetical protein